MRPAPTRQQTVLTLPAATGVSAGVGPAGGAGDLPAVTDATRRAAAAQDLHSLADGVAAGLVSECEIELRSGFVQQSFFGTTKAESIAWMSDGYNAAGLMQKKIASLEWVIPGFLPVGLTMLGAKRKRGKSWLSLNLGLAVASGSDAVALGKYSVPDKSVVLMLALEDNERRMQGRIGRIIGDNPAPDCLHIFHAWPRIGSGFEDRIQHWMKIHPTTRLIVVDVLAKVRPERSARDAYQGDYAAMEPLHALAHKHSIGVLVLTHLRKAGGDDPFDFTMGTGGVTGAADTLMVMTRDPATGATILHVTGRDVEEQEFAMQFDPAHGLWTITGSAEDARRSSGRNSILKALQAESGGMRPSAIAKSTGLNEWTVRSLIRRMLKAGEIRKNGESYEI